MKKMNRILQLNILFFFITIKTFGQFQYDETDQVIPFSYINSDIHSLKEENKINTLYLQSYNNDSLYWVNNAAILYSEQTTKFELNYTRRCGFQIDTTFRFFDVANKFKIEEGYLWLYKIYSPTAYSLGVVLKNLQLSSNEYICAFSNLHDSINRSTLFPYPYVETGNDVKQEMEYRPILKERGYSLSDDGNIFILEIFSPNDSIQNSGLTIESVSYCYPTNYKLSDAPDWVRKKYPKIDFEFYEKKR